MRIANPRITRTTCKASQQSFDILCIKDKKQFLKLFSILIQVNVLVQDVAGRSAGAVTFATYLTEIFLPCNDGTDSTRYLRF